MSTFSGLTAALTSLHAQRRSMEVASQNVANANTEGYSRQRVALEAIGGSVIPGIYAKANGVGSGVSVRDVERIRDAFLENRGRIEHAQLENMNTERLILGRVEQVFGEPSDTGIQAQLNELWDAFSDLANRPGDPAARTAVLRRAEIVVDSFRGTAQALDSIWQTTHEQLGSAITEINTMAANVANLNKAIVAARAAGQPVNELSDERDLQVMRLAEMAGARGVARDDGSVDVLLGASSLVYGSAARALAPQVAGRLRIEPDPTVPGGDPPRLVWADDPTVTIDVQSGRAAAYLKVLGTSLPGYLSQVDDVAGVLVANVNDVHNDGFDRAGVRGGDFFESPVPPATVKAKTIRLAAAIQDHPELIAASAVGTDPPAAPTPNLNGENAKALAALAVDTDGTDYLYRQLVIGLGVDAQTINRRADIQAAVSQEVDAARSGDNGVNLDEEMTNMVAFERAYQAAAKVISTIDEMLDTLINRMGG